MLRAVGRRAAPASPGPDREPAPGPVDYDVVIVAYHSRELVEGLLPALGTAPVTVVDNSHDADGLSEVAARYSHVTYVDGPGRGFASALNIGARRGDAPVLVQLNPDARPTADLLDLLTAPLTAPGDLALTSALDIDEHGRGQGGAGGWEPSVRRAVAHTIGLHKLLPTAGLWARPDPDRPLDVDWVGGSVWAIRREVFDAVGGLDERYFVYGEDVELGRSLRCRGYTVDIRTDLLVSGAKSGSGDSRPRMLRHRGHSMTTYLRRHHPWFRVAGVRSVLTLGMAARWVLARLTGRRTLAEDHGAYVRGLWSGPPSSP